MKGREFLIERDGDGFRVRENTAKNAQHPYWEEVGHAVHLAAALQLVRLQVGNPTKIKVMVNGDNDGKGKEKRIS